MKQFQFEYSDLKNLKNELSKIRQWCHSRVTSYIVFHVYTETTDIGLISHICSEISYEMPSAQYLGCSTSGNIIDGGLSDSQVSIICTVFEYPSTEIEILQYPLTAETEASVVEELLGKIAERPWVKAVELHTTIRGMSMTDFCDGLGKAAPGIQIFGGGAFSPDIDDDHAVVFSKGGRISENSVVFMLVGGDDLHVISTYITGWKPLGKTFHVTSSTGNLLKTLDDQPAYDVYNRYLNIKNNKHFFFNTLEFPFFYKHNGIDILRAPTACLDDGTLVMTSDVEENVTARLAYGDPGTILESVKTEGAVVRDFCPETIRIFSCAARRTFWGNSEVSKESVPFGRLAPTSGFYTSGEFLRTNGFVNQHNVTMVITAMREGSFSPEMQRRYEVDNESFSGKVSLISRLASYINAAFEELERAAITDGMTKLYNRTEIQRRINERLDAGQTFSLIMFDIDNFKLVNDTFGHSEGDRVIIGVADLLRFGIGEHNPEANAGRWGGEEFMLMLPFDVRYAELAAADLIKDFNNIDFPKAGRQTVSVGVTQAKEDDTIDSLLVRVDKALYQAKKTGKNKYVIL